MPGYLRQATASQSRAIGPFVSDSDFKTVQTGLTIANTDIKLVVNGAASANKNSGGGTHRVNGVYGVTFDATDTATVGEMEVSVVVAGALPVFDKFFVVEEAVYDALFAASAAVAATLSSTERNSLADAFLDRDMSVGTDSGSPTVRTPRQAFRVLRNKVAAPAGTMTVYKEDDSTSSWTAAITTDSSAQPITTIDPA
jgi:hypothetical protein